MIQLRTLFTSLLALNFVTLIFLIFRNDQETLNPEAILANSVPESEYKFHDPLLAYHILKKLDVFEPVDVKYYDNMLKPGNKFTTPFMSLIHDPDYCDKHRAYFAENPEFIFNQINFMTDWPKSALLRGKVAQVVGNDIHPNISASIPSKYNTSYLFNIKPNVNSFFINGPMHIYQHIGKSFACLSQIYNHIPGHGGLNRKDMVAESIVNYADKYKNRPQCFTFDRFFPKTWLLDNETQCREFFKVFNSPEYFKLKEERTIVYIKKKGFGAHRAEGVDPLNDAEEKTLRKDFQNGTLCGQKKMNLIMQNFIHNPLLLGGNKFDFRIYMVVASTNPLILFYHDGFLRLSLHEYDVKSNDKGVLLTNTELSKKIFEEVSKGGLFKGMNETQLRDFQMWTFPMLRDHLLKTKVITDENWLDNHLRPQFKRAMVHLLRMSQHTFLQRSSIYELFGADFILDDKLNLWFLECNTSPMLKGTSVEKERFLVKMLKDHYEIIYGLLRSRMKRVMNFVNELTLEIKASNLSWDKYINKNLENFRGKFKTLSKNRFEPEFTPGPENGFTKIIDENYEGPARYANLIPKECL